MERPGNLNPGLAEFVCAYEIGECEWKMPEGSKSGSRLPCNGGLRGKGSGRQSAGLGKFCRLFFAKIKHLLSHPVPL